MFQRPLRVRFREFEMDEHAGELRKDGIKVRLQEQPLQILQILLERPGEVVTRDDLRKRIWPSDTFVDFDHGINNAIKRLREALDGIVDAVVKVNKRVRRPDTPLQFFSGNQIPGLLQQNLKKL
jgi:DNA-binding winged helix-turn-helix (wHTH) protein